MTNPPFPEAATKAERALNWQKIAEISGADFGFKEPAPTTPAKYRFAVRILLLSDRGEICVVKSEKYNYLQILGGGIEPNESIIAAAKRETREESGYLLRDIEALGYTIEYRDPTQSGRDWTCSVSFVFRATAAENVGTSYTEDEIAEGFTPVWLSADEIAKTLQSSAGQITDYNGNFSNRRDLMIIQKNQQQTFPRK